MYLFTMYYEKKKHTVEIEQNVSDNVPDVYLHKKNVWNVDKI